MSTVAETSTHLFGFGPFEWARSAISLPVIFIVLVFLYFWIRSSVKELFRNEDPLVPPPDSLVPVGRKKCGNRSVVTLNRFNDCLLVLKHQFARSRPTPHVLYKHKIFSLFGEDHRGGLAYNSWKQTARFRRVFSYWLDSSSANAWINFSVCEKVRELGLICTAKGNLEETVTLQDVEEWVLEILMGLLLQDETKRKTARAGVWRYALSRALDDLFAAKEELCKMVHDFNFLGIVKQHVKPFVYMYRYNKAYKLAKRALQSYGIEEFTKIEWKIESKIEEILPKKSDYNAEVYGVYIELLAMCKKKLGYFIFQAMADVSSTPDWQACVRACLSPLPSDDGQLKLLSDETRFAPILAVVQESMRLNYKPYTCHLRVAIARIPLGVNQKAIRKKNIVHAVTRIPNYVPNLSTLHPEAWCVNSRAAEGIDPLLFHSARFFGEGQRKCIGEQFAMTVIGAFIGHFVTAGLLTLPDAEDSSESDTQQCISFRPRPDYDVDEAPVIRWHD